MSPVRSHGSEADHTTAEPSDRIRKIQICRNLAPAENSDAGHRSPANAAAFHAIVSCYRILVDNVTRIIYEKRIIKNCAKNDLPMPCLPFGVGRGAVAFCPLHAVAFLEKFRFGAPPDDYRIRFCLPSANVA